MMVFDVDLMTFTLYLIICIIQWDILLFYNMLADLVDDIMNNCKTTRLNRNIVPIPTN